MQPKILAYSLLIDTKKPLLTQIGKPMVTFLVGSVLDGAIETTKRGSCWVCTWNALELLPSDLKTIVDASVPEIISDGSGAFKSTHAPFVTTEEKLMYTGTSFVRSLSTYRTSRSKWVDDVMQQAIIGRKLPVSDHFFVVNDGNFCVAK